MEKIKYLFERFYPYITSIALVYLLYCFEIDFLANEKLYDALGGVISFDAIVIGFLGAIMPVILSMKNESKLVKYVFENDGEELFKKYLFVTIKIGITNVVLTLAMYLHTSFTVETFVKILLYLWLLSLFTFMFCTMRSMGYMISLLFSKDMAVEYHIGSAEEGSVLSEKERAEVKSKFSDKS